MAQIKLKGKTVLDKNGIVVYPNVLNAIQMKEAINMKLGGSVSTKDKTFYAPFTILECDTCQYCDKDVSDWDCFHPNESNTPQVLTPYITPKWCPIIKNSQK